jgi:hypothetical protein
MRRNSASSSILSDRVTCSRCARRIVRPSPLSINFARHITRVQPTPKQASRLAQARLDWERERRHSLRTLLIQQYEESERPKWQRTAKRLGNDEASTEEPGYWSTREAYSCRNRRQRLGQEELQCGIFWDIENVRNEYVLNDYADPGHILLPSSLRLFGISLDVDTPLSSKLICLGPH